MLKEMRKMTGDGSVVVLPTSISGLFHQSLTKQLDGLVAFSTFKDLLRKICCQQSDYIPALKPSDRITGLTSQYFLPLRRKMRTVDIQSNDHLTIHHVDRTIASAPSNRCCLCAVLLVG